MGHIFFLIIFIKLKKISKRNHTIFSFCHVFSFLVRFLSFPSFLFYRNYLIFLTCLYLSLKFIFPVFKLFFSFLFIVYSWWFPGVLQLLLLSFRSWGLLQLTLWNILLHTLQDTEYRTQETEYRIRNTEQATE